jgi:hypothetical protein
VVSRVHEGGARTVIELLPDAYRDFFAVGRLDKDSEGLLLLSNDPRRRLQGPSPAAHRGRPDRAGDLSEGAGRDLAPAEVATLRAFLGH